MGKSIEINHPWNEIHRTGGYSSNAVVPGFIEAVQLFRENGCQRVLDLGCGSGRHTLGLLKTGFVTVGLDIAPAGLKLTREKMTAALLPTQLMQLILADFRSLLPFASGSFDAVLSTQVIHHACLAQVRCAIAEIWRILRSGGMIYVSVGGKRGPGPWEETEPGTIVPCEGQEAGLPHHIFSINEACQEFWRFRIMDVSSRADGQVILIKAQKA